MPCSAHAATSRSTSGPGTSTALAHRRSHSSSHPPKAAAVLAQALPGNRGTKHSGRTASCAPWSAASPSSRTAFSTEASASRITGVACTAATRTVGNSVMRVEDTSPRAGRLTPMSRAEPALVRDELARRAGEIRWYHGMDLGHGVRTAGLTDPAASLPRLALPANLHGRRVLDVGAWD